MYSGHNVIKAFNKEEDVIRAFNRDEWINCMNAAWRSQFFLRNDDADHAVYWESQAMSV